MGSVVKVIVDFVLFLSFSLFTIDVPLFISQTCLPQEYYPKVLVNIYSWYANEFEDYLVIEKPKFFVGLVWMELLVIWPLAILNLFGLISRKSWFNTTCMIFGFSVTTSMAAILSELTGSGKASKKLLLVYYPFLGVAVLAILRGWLPSTFETATIGRRPIADSKKIA